MNSKYLFKSERLGFRTWNSDDAAEFASLNADPEVMKHFPKPLTYEESVDFLNRLQNHYAKNAYCYFACEIFETGELIGFIGLALQDYQSEFTPATDIGWRLKKSAWGKGYATEGALACLQYAFKVLKINKIVSTCTVKNFESEHVMQKIGMQKRGIFRHPKLKDYLALEQCVWYEIDNNNIRDKI